MESAAGCDSFGIVAVWLVIAGAGCIAFPDFVVMLRGGEGRSLLGGRNDRRTVRIIGIGNVIIGLLALSLSAVLGHFCQFPARGTTVTVKVETAPPSVAWEPGMDPARAYRLVDLPNRSNAISLMLMTPAAATTYRVTFEPSGEVTFQKGMLGHYWLNRDRVPALNPYGSMPGPPDAWQPSTRDQGVADIHADNVRGLFAAKSTWSAQGAIGAPCSENYAHYIASTEKLTNPPIEILLRGRDAPVRLDCDPRATAFENEAMRLLSALVPSITLHNTEPSGAILPSVPQGLANGPATFRNQLELDPEMRAEYAVHQRFMNLYYRMPTFEHAAFGPTVTFMSWRSVKWNVQSIYVKPDGSQIAELTYGPGPGVDYSTVTNLIGGHYVGNVSMNWAALTNDRHLAGELMGHNQLPVDCRDARSDATPYAVLPTLPGGTSITKAALRSATLGVSDLPGTHVICYRFGRLHLVEFAHLTDAVIYRLDHGQLVPVTRGDVRLSDPSGWRVLIVVDAGYDENNLPLHDYLEAFAHP